MPPERTISFRRSRLRRERRNPPGAWFSLRRILIACPPATPGIRDDKYYSIFKRGRLKHGQKNSRESLLADWLPAHPFRCRSAETCGKLRYCGCLLGSCPVRRSPFLRHSLRPFYRFPVSTLRVPRVADKVAFSHALL